MSQINIGTARKLIAEIASQDGPHGPELRSALTTLDRSWSGDTLEVGDGREDSIRHVMMAVRHQHERLLARGRAVDALVIACALDARLANRSGIQQATWTIRTEAALADKDKASPGNDLLGVLESFRRINPNHPARIEFRDLHIRTAMAMEIAVKFRCAHELSQAHAWFATTPSASLTDYITAIDRVMKAFGGRNNSSPDSDGPAVPKPAENADRGDIGTDRVDARQTSDERLYAARAATAAYNRVAGAGNETPPAKSRFF